MKKIRILTIMLTRRDGLEVRTPHEEINNIDEITRYIAFSGSLEFVVASSVPLNRFIHESRYSVLDGAYKIHSIYVSGKAFVLGTKFDGKIISEITYNFNEDNVGGLLLGDPDTGVFNFIPIESLMAEENNEISISKNEFSLNEIKSALTDILDKPEVEEFINEFISFKAKIGVVIEEPKENCTKLISNLDCQEICDFLRSVGYSKYAVQKNDFIFYPRCNDISMPGSLTAMQAALLNGYKYVSSKEFLKIQRQKPLISNVKSKTL